MLGSAAGPHSDVDDVRIAETHDGKRAEIVENEMNALPLRVDIRRIVSRGVAHDHAGFRSVTIEKENMSVHAQADASEGEQVVLGVSDSAVGLFPGLPVEAERAIYEWKEGRVRVRRSRAGSGSSELTKTDCCETPARELQCDKGHEGN